MGQIPQYAGGPMNRFLDTYKLAMQLLHLSMRGIGLLQSMPEVFEALVQVENRHSPEEKDQYEKDLVVARQEAQLAVEQEKQGFPLLHAHTLVTIWGALEAAIEDVLLGILMNEPHILHGASFPKIKITLGDFENLDKEDRMRLVLSELCRDQGQGRRARGVDYFEVMLQPFGLSDAVDAEIKKNLWTVHNLRNAVVHRSFLADRRLVEACPWLLLKPGDPIIITHEMLHEYASACPAYVSTITKRIDIKYNPTTSRFRAGAETEDNRSA